MCNTHLCPTLLSPPLPSPPLHSPSPSLPCSAGVGRSGTFIAIDAQIQRLKDLNNVNIYHFVREMRNCRTHMVQTLVGGREEWVGVLWSRWV